MPVIGTWRPLNETFVPNEPLGPQISVEELRTVHAIFNKIQGIGITIVRSNGEGFTFIAEQESYSFKVTKLPDTTAVAKVTVASGYCQYASQTEVLKAASTVSCTSSGDIYIKLDLATGVWDDPAFATSTPVDTDALSYYRIASVTVASGKVTQVIQRHLGDIYESRV